MLVDNGYAVIHSVVSHKGMDTRQGDEMKNLVVDGSKESAQVFD